MTSRVILFLLVALLSGCSSLKITSNTDKDIDISKSKTYSFYGWTEVNDMIDIDKKAIEKAFVQELAQRGLTHKEIGGDIVISLFLIIDKNSTTNRYNTYYGHGPYGFYQPTWGWGMGYGYAGGSPYAGVPYKENAYYKGTLVCDVFDKATKKLAWQGVISKAINTKKKKKSNTQKLVGRVMNTFPIEIIEK